MKWDAALYQKQHGFVSEYGKALFSLLPPEPARDLLDVGCGTGALTAQLAQRAGNVLGIDSSKEMVRQARQNHPALRFEVMDATRLPFRDAFDIAFSNAVFHWIPDQAGLLSSLFSALRPGGLLIAEFGGRGNVDRVIRARDQALARHGLTSGLRLFYPGPEEYRPLLEAAGFQVELLELFDRPTPLADGRAGLGHWVRQFCAADFAPLDEAAREAALAEMEELLEPDLWDGRQWIADYRRLRLAAKKPR